MAPKYKVTYFNLRSLAEPIRYILSYGGADFEDVRIQNADWPALKPSVPLGKMPLMEVDGKLANQSIAICRYLAKQFGLLGSNDWEALEIDSIVDSIIDARQELAGFYHEENEAAKAKKKEKLLKETLPMYLSRLDKLAKDNGGHLVGGKLTWADLYFAAVIETMGHVIDKPLTADYPNLKSLEDRVHALPAIKAWVAKRPVTEW